MMLTKLCQMNYMQILCGWANKEIQKNTNVEIKILFCNIVNEESLQTGFVVFDLFVADMDVSIFFFYACDTSLPNK